MKVEWENFALGEVCKFTTGSAFKHIYQGKLVGKYPFIKVSDMNLPSNEIYIRVANNYIDESILKLSKAKLHKRNSIVFAKIGVALTTNRRRMLITDTAIDNNMMSAAALEEYITPQYLYYLLCTLDFNLIAAGTALPYINISDLQKWQIALPSLAEQTRIGNFLIAIDKKIDLLKETNKTLESIAQSMFKSWFVDFDPVHAKQQGIECAGIDKATADLFPNSFVESELGLIPKDWIVKNIGDVVDCVGGGTPDTKNESYWLPEKYYWTTPKDLSGLTSPILIKTDRMISEAGLKKISSGLLDQGTLLLSSRAPIGYLAISQCPIAINQGYIAITNKGKLPPTYMLFWCKFYMELIKSSANGSTFMEISKRVFRELKIICPSEKLIDHFQKIVEPIFEKMANNEYAVSTLTNARDNLLPRLISGKLDLSNIEEKIEGVA